MFKIFQQFNVLAYRESNFFFGEKFENRARKRQIRTAPQDTRTRTFPVKLSLFLAPNDCIFDRSLPVAVFLATSVRTNVNATNKQTHRSVRTNMSITKSIAIEARCRVSVRGIDVSTMLETMKCILAKLYSQWPPTKSAHCSVEFVNKHVASIFLKQIEEGWRSKGEE